MKKSLTYLISFIVLISFSKNSFSQSDILDSTFSYDGYLNFSLSDICESLTGGVIQSDGKILLTGYYNVNTYISCIETSNYIMRLNVDGSLDSTFGTAGIVLGDSIDGTGVNGSTIALQSDQKIVMYCRSHGDGFVLRRFNQDGSVDNSFGVDGKTVIDYYPYYHSGFGRFFPMYILPDDRILIGLRLSTSLPSLFNDFATLALFDSDGIIDEDFGIDNPDPPFGELAGFIFEVEPSSGNGMDVYSIAVTLDEKILVAILNLGYINSYPIIRRYNIDGTVDSTYGVDGAIYPDYIDTVPQNINTILVLPDNKVIAHFEYSSENQLVLKLNANGSIDSTFGINGFTEPIANSNIYLNSMVTLSDGKIVLSGSPNSLDDSIGFVVRYTPEGLIDTSFSNDGIFVYSVAQSAIKCNLLLADSYDKCIVSGDFVDYDSSYVARLPYTDEPYNSIVTNSQFEKYLLYPNPIGNRAALSYFLQADDVISVDLISCDGKLITHFIENEKRHAGSNSDLLNFDPTLPIGIYLLRITCGLKSYGISVLKSR